ncbi:MAG: hypothetical protein ACD_28C00251G0001 [uncultured bacterium]|nr:MAG: hypothetical protein ACD_28C00251G0001 [uncultured bacterium]
MPDVQPILPVWVVVRVVQVLLQLAVEEELMVAVVVMVVLYQLQPVPEVQHMILLQVQLT